VKNFSIISFGSEYSADRLTLAAEYRVLQGSVDIEIDSTSVGGGIVRANQDIHSDGGYLLAAYRLNDAWEIGSYYGIYFSDRNDRDGDRYAGTGTDRARAWQRDLALTVRWDVNPSWIVKLEGHYLDGTAMLSPGMNEDGWTRHWFLFAAKTTLSF